mmetsp:Transcript_25534/g.37706  ORF Transcript_25534/g.37706 Transcript_25534/m.37706 type:complete len:839 (+) Transcript_25534:165-2681(+)|eukprot:CAMPEP_0185026998 /NCGR_PEP_ID=MMETSP1103-20130426/11760_1 /TAXON_ID=36769 /ORGANISM="Paraphysomonas bandaiensis, Strain Caron Lab Isolate" /LENGTH=838 /DNA_ID=CAMNT_0027560811 /DNA_START=103 /DNA_END=2619 /DNA_ORIENTATION=-
MSSLSYIDEVLAVINEARLSADKRELTSIELEEINNSFYIDVKVVATVDAESSTVEAVATTLKGILSGESGDETDRNGLMLSVATHLAVQVDEREDGVEVIIKIVNKYIELDPVGPFINGNLVLQGSSLYRSHTPALCNVEFAADHDEDYREVCTVMPWEMILQAADVEDGSDAVAIPISLPTECVEGTVRIAVYVDERERVSHDEPDPAFDLESPTLIRALDFSTTATGEQQVAEGEQEATPLYLIATTLKVAPEPDSTHALNNDGFEVCPIVDMTNGFERAPGAGEWRFGLGVNRSTAEENVEGIEDLVFVTKTEGGEIETPEGYTLDETNLAEGQEVEVHLAVKYGANPKYSHIIPVSCEVETQEQVEDAFQSFITDNLGGGAELRVAPNPLNQSHGFRVGIVLVYKGNSTADMYVMSGGVAELEVKDAADAQEGEEDEKMPSEMLDAENDEQGRVGCDDEVSRMTGEEGFSSSDEDDEEEEDRFNIDEEAISTLSRRLQELEMEKEKALAANSEWQKKCSAILARIGRDSQSRGGEPQDVSDPATNSAENNNEKESHFTETLQAISEGRMKSIRQQTEYDQLALDLQTRLDDKEFKAEEISDSLNEFKREILLKAENSRTAKGISRRLIKHYETTERKKDSELEKVRLRNISLKTTLRRLEKTLRSREQLAEGLHMIDFEQLKIENQTLSEKIEERNEELAKLKRKKTVTVQILTHIREKLRHVDTHNLTAREELLTVDRDIVVERSKLTASKHERDIIRDENVELKRRRGFATSDMLIIDFEKRKNSMENLQQSIKELKERHFLLTQHISTNNMTIRNAEMAKTSLPPIGKKR